MRSPAGALVGVEFPLFAFSHCRDVVAAVTNAGGFGVLGGTTFTPEGLETELAWLDAHTGGRPYGVDILIPAKVASGISAGGEAVAGDGDPIPEGHRAFVKALLADHGVGAPDPRPPRSRSLGVLPEVAADLLDVAFQHPIKLIANALGVPTPAMVERAHAAGVPVASLVGSPKHARRQVAAGVDLLVAQGGEAGGHTGEISTLVLVPEVIAAIDGAIPVLGAGGIVTGRQMAAVMALGAAGAWTGSVWLTTEEAETAPATKAKMLAATSADTVRSRSRTGKPSRQLRSAWTDAWETPGAPQPLPMPLQTILTEPALRRVDTAAAAGDAGAIDLATYWVGQGVGLLESVRPVRAVVEEWMLDFAGAAERLGSLLTD